MIRDHQIEIEPTSMIADSPMDYIRNDTVIEEIVRTIRQGRYCSILGPRSCQKSLLLMDIQNTLTQMRRATVLVDMKDLPRGPDNEFLKNFAQLVSERVQKKLAILPPSSPSDVGDEMALKHFLKEYVQKLRQDLVLLIDHLERVRSKPLESLLLSLRGVYTEQTHTGKYQLLIVTASSLRIAGIALGQTSPFNIAHIVLIHDLSPADSEKLIKMILEPSGITVTAAACERLIQATNGDRYLIPTLCAYSLEILKKNRTARITPQEVEEAIEWFISERDNQHRPLQETIRAIEANPPSMINVLKMLDSAPISHKQLNQESEPDMDELQLTGAVTVKTVDGEKYYQIRNDIYRRCLKQHFHAERIVQVLSMAGQWDQAIDYLVRIVPTEPRLKALLLRTIIDSIYAARNKSQVYTKLAHRLSSAFAIPKARLYIENPERSCLELVSQAGFSEDSKVILLNDESRPAVRIYNSGQYELIRSVTGEQQLLVPLIRDEGQPLGMAVLDGFEAHPEEDDFVELLDFIKRITKAIGTVIDRERDFLQGIGTIIDRERGFLQLANLYGTEGYATDFLNLGQVMQTTVEAAIDAVSGAQRGALFIWDERIRRLCIKAYKHFRKGIDEKITLGSGEGYAGKVFAEGEPIIIVDASKDERVLLRQDPDIQKQKSVVCVPLRAWGRVIGVLCLDNTDDTGVFQEKDLNLLSALTAHAAIAIQNARLYTELLELGRQINTGDLNPWQVFEHTAQSITRVSDVKGANILLFREATESHPDRAKQIELSVSNGLGEDYDQKVQPRPNGLTAHVVESGTYCAVSNPNEAPGINDLTLERGVRAILALPMKIQGRIIGVLFVYHNQPHRFTRSEINLLSLFANQAALAIQNMRLLEELKMQYRSLARQEALKITSRMVAHRLRNVLPIISDRISRTLNREMVVGDGVEWCRLALAESRQAQTIIKDFEKFSRPGRYELPDLVSGGELAERLGQIVKDAINQADAQVVVSYNSNLPLVRVSLHALCDDFTNFINDSQRYKAHGLCVTIACDLASENELLQAGIKGEGRYLKVSYIDNGPGIPSHLKRQIFEPYYTTTAGSGLGLAIASHNADVHGGALIECGQPGHGVRFELYLPVVTSTKKDELS